MEQLGEARNPARLALQDKIQHILSENQLARSTKAKAIVTPPDTVRRDRLETSLDSSAATSTADETWPQSRSSAPAQEPVPSQAAFDQRKSI